MYVETESGHAVRRHETKSTFAHSLSKIEKSFSEEPQYLDNSVARAVAVPKVASLAARKLGDRWEGGKRGCVPPKPNSRCERAWPNIAFE